MLYHVYLFFRQSFQTHTHTGTQNQPTSLIRQRHRQKAALWWVNNCTVALRPRSIAASNEVRRNTEVMGTTRQGKGDTNNAALARWPVASMHCSNNLVARILWALHMRVVLCLCGVCSLMQTPIAVGVYFWSGVLSVQRLIKKVGCVVVGVACCVLLK